MAKKSPLKHQILRGYEYSDGINAKSLRFIIHTDGALTVSINGTNLSESIRYSKKDAKNFETLTAFLKEDGIIDIEEELEHRKYVYDFIVETHRIYVLIFYGKA